MFYVFMYTAGSRYEFVVATGDLVINNVQATDAGNYTCMASNEVGMASAILEVLVRGERSED